MVPGILPTADVAGQWFHFIIKRENRSSAFDPWWKNPKTTYAGFVGKVGIVFLIPANYIN